MLKAFIDILFPPVCPLCEKGMAGAVFCKDCDAALASSRITGAVCIVCGAPFAAKTGQAHACGECLLEAPPFVRARSAFIYEGAALDAVHAFKYNGRVQLAVGLGRLAASAISLEAAPRPGRECFSRGVVVPVPLHLRRLRERGFNQSLLIAREVAATLGMEVDYRSLRRTRYTEKQTGLTAAERRKNVVGAFEAARPERVCGKSVLLVDDVFTTGTTARECAKVLKAAGAVVSVLTLARAVRL